MLSKIAGLKEEGFSSREPEKGGGREGADAHLRVLRLCDRKEGLKVSVPQSCYSIASFSA